MLISWQNSLIRENCNTFIVLNSTILSISKHDIEKSDTAFLRHRYLTICFLVSIALHCILGAYLWCSHTVFCRKFCFLATENSRYYKPSSKRKGYTQKKMCTFIHVFQAKDNRIRDPPLKQLIDISDPRCGLRNKGKVDQQNGCTILFSPQKNKNKNKQSSMQC